MLLLRLPAASAPRLRAFLRDRQKKNTAAGRRQHQQCVDSTGRNREGDRNPRHWVGVSNIVCGVQQSALGQTIPLARPFVVGTVPGILGRCDRDGACAAGFTVAGHVCGGRRARVVGVGPQGILLHQASVASSP